MRGARARRARRGQRERGAWQGLRCGLRCGRRRRTVLGHALRRLLQAQLEEAEAENTELTARNAELTQEVIALQGGTEAVEKSARENLGLIKEGEVYYQFVEEPKAP